MACGDDGIAVFERIRYMRYDHTVLLYAFDLIELNGHDLRREPLETRKATPASLRARAGAGVRLNEHLEHANGVQVRRPSLAPFGSRVSQVLPVAQSPPR